VLTGCRKTVVFRNNFSLPGLYSLKNASGGVGLGVFRPGVEGVEAQWPAFAGLHAFLKTVLL
jgi:hypothetical protein